MGRDPLNVSESEASTDRVADPQQRSKMNPVEDDNDEAHGDRS